MPLPNHVAFRVELAEILANAAALHTRIKQYQADQETRRRLDDLIPDDLAIEYAEKQQHFEGELKSILDDLVCKYQETPLSTLECFYFPGDAEDVEDYGQALMDWTSDIRKHLIQLNAETTRMQDKEKESEIPKDCLLSEFLNYEQRLKSIYHSVVRFEHWLKIKYKPAPLALLNPRQPSSLSLVQVIPDTGRISCPKPNDGVALTERLDKIRNSLAAFQTSRPGFSSRLCEIHEKYRLESLQSSLSSQSSNDIYQAVNNITSECLSRLLSTAKAEFQQVLADNEQAFHAYLERKLNASYGLIQVVLGVTNAALMSVPEEGELIE